MILKLNKNILKSEVNKHGFVYRICAACFVCSPNSSMTAVVSSDLMKFLNMAQLSQTLSLGDLIKMVGHVSRRRRLKELSDGKNDFAGFVSLPSISL